MHICYSHTCAHLFIVGENWKQSERGKAEPYHPQTGRWELRTCRPAAHLLLGAPTRVSYRHSERSQRRRGGVSERLSSRRSLSTELSNPQFPPWALSAREDRFSSQGRGPEVHTTPGELCHKPPHLPSSLPRAPRLFSESLPLPGRPVPALPFPPEGRTEP